MIKKRRNTEKTETPENGVSVYNKKVFKNYRDQAIEVLNILDSQGINIYSEDNFGGMYLKQNKSDKLLSKINGLFKTEEKEESTIDNELLSNFFNKKQ